MTVTVERPGIGKSVGYTPIWTSLDGGTAPAIGNGTLAARWLITADGLCHVELQMVTGSTTTFGNSHEWGFGLPPGLTPVPPLYGATNAFGATVLNFARGRWWAFQHSVGYWEGSVAIDTDDTGSGIPQFYSYFNTSGAGTAAVHTTNPFTWANGDIFTMFAEFPVA